MSYLPGFETDHFDLPGSRDDGYYWKRNDSLKGCEITVPGGKLFYAENYFNKKDSDMCIEHFLKNGSCDWRKCDWREFDKEKLSKVEFENIKWQHDSINMFGKNTYLPRYSAWYGDRDKPYTYSGLTLQPNKWDERLLYIKSEIEKVADVKFNSVLMNWYRDGDDHLAWHTDAEKELGSNPVIGSVNFGESRRFLLRRKDDKEKKFELQLKHGTLLIMSGALQHFWQHSVPKQKAAKSNRINLTFRTIVS